MIVGSLLTLEYASVFLDLWAVTLSTPRQARVRRNPIEGNAQMKLSLKVIGHPIIAGLVAIFFVQILGIGPVRSEVSVVNPYFQDPPINSATRGVIVCPQTTPA